MQRDDTVHALRQGEVMRCDQRRRAARADQPDELGEHLRCGRFVEVAGRFVGEHQHRFIGQRAGNGDALLLAARQLRRTVVEPRAEAEVGEQQRRPRLRRRRAGAADQLRQNDVLARAEVGQ